MSYLALLSITPIGKGESVSKEVAKAFKIVKNSGLKYQLTSMGTIVEADDLKKIFDVIHKAIEEVEKENNRISVLIKMDCRKNREDAITYKVESVLEKIGDT
ncbi:MAG: MTH1187 family thiamine-binding protein [Candidatus Calescibacterium sp.]|nr:MTH1187 family thiamine-binding protein [Candidatus Calescibacterium sp.]MDW8132125.1 MTH1187 family thiamine-binding protein [Candidatus Calescibacterium sp.]